MISLSGQSVALVLMPESIGEQKNTNSYEYSVEHAEQNHEHSDHHLADETDECCDIDCCDGICVCPLNSCASGLFLDISTPFPSLHLWRTFALSAIHNVVEVHLPSWYRPPISVFS